MSKEKQTPEQVQSEVQEQPKLKSGAFGRFVRRFFLVLFTLVLLLVAGRP